VLVLVKAIDGFQATLGSLERALMRPERISYQVLPSAQSNGAGNGGQDAQSWSFKPP
jgi:hypothetical protein